MAAADSRMRWVLIALVKIPVENRASRRSCCSLIGAAAAPPSIAGWSSRRRSAVGADDGLVQHRLQHPRLVAEPGVHRFDSDVRAGSDRVDRRGWVSRVLEQGCGGLDDPLLGGGGTLGPAGPG